MIDLDTEREAGGLRLRLAGKESKIWRERKRMQRKVMKSGRVYKKKIRGVC